VRGVVENAWLLSTSKIMIDVILESLGINNVVKKYVPLLYNEINDCIDDALNKISKDSEIKPYYTFVYNETVEIRKNVSIEDYKILPINKIGIIFRLDLHNKNIKPNITANININQLNFINLKKDDDNIASYEKIIINLNFTDSIKNIKLNNYSYAISHELTHTLEMFNLSINNIEKTMAHKTNFGISDYYMSNNKTPILDFINLLYLILPHELNARVAQVYHEIKPVLEKEININNYPDLSSNLITKPFKEEVKKIRLDFKKRYLELLKNTETYQNYSYIKNFDLDRLKNNDKLLIEVNKLFESISKRTGMKHKPFNNITGLLNKLKNKKDDISKIHLRKLSSMYIEIINDIIREYIGDRLEDNFNR
jgi:hypothetical protein